MGYLLGKTCLWIGPVYVKTIGYLETVYDCNIDGHQGLVLPQWGQLVCLQAHPATNFLYGQEAKISTIIASLSSQPGLCCRGMKQENIFKQKIIFLVIADEVTSSISKHLLIVLSTTLCCSHGEYLWKWALPPRRYNADSHRNPSHQFQCPCTSH